MQTEGKEKSFKMTYSAKEQEELVKIREKYEDREETKLDRLRRLDASVTKKATTVSLVAGISGALIMGIGMSFTMTDIGTVIGMDNVVGMTVGIVTGIAGILLVAAAFPLYKHAVEKEKKKIAPQIFELTEELMR